MDSPPALRSLLPSLEHPAAVVGSDYRIRDANSSCTALFGDETPLIGRLCYNAFHARTEPCDREGEVCPMRRYRETGEPLRTVHLHTTHGGEEHHDVVVYPVEGEEDGPTTFVGVLKPISIAKAYPCRDSLVGRSFAFRRMLELILRVAGRATPVLLLGETGTGRERIARAVHRASPRASYGFAAVSCAGLSSSEFTGELIQALSRAAGTVVPVLTTAGPRQPGTLYLADIEELPPEAQGELLRLLKRGAWRGAGDEAAAAFDFRLISAAEPLLRERVDRGAFSPELYYRIGTFPIPVPPLRERLDDLSLLAANLLLEIACCPSPELAPASLAVLRRYPFPGNLAELRSILERACVRAGNGTILPEHMPEELLEPAL